MNLFWKRSCALAATLMLLLAVPVSAEPDEGGTPPADDETTTTVTTTTTTEETTTTTTVTTTTEATTTTTEAATTTTQKATTTTTKAGGTTKATTTTTKATTTTTKATTTTTKADGTTTVTTTLPTETTETTLPTEPTDTEPTEPDVPAVELPEPFVLVGEPGEENEWVYFCDTDGHYPSDILNGNKFDGYTDDWWVDGRNGGMALRLDSSKGRYLRCSRYMFDDRNGGSKMDGFTLSLWVNRQLSPEGEAAVGQKLFCASTQDLDTRWQTGDRLQWDPDIWYVFVSPHMQDSTQNLDGLYIEWNNQNLWESGSAFTPSGESTTTALPLEEWHHVAVTMSDSEFALYVDGCKLYACRGTTEFSAVAPFLDRFFIGRGMEGDATLDALIDDALLYPQVLTEAQIALLADDRDPADGTLPSDPEYLATNPMKPTTAPATSATTFATTRISRAEADGDKFPVAVVAIPGAVLLVTVILSLALGQKKEEPAPEAESEDEETEETAETEETDAEVDA